MTTKTLQQLEALCQAGGMSDLQLGEALGLRKETVRYWRIRMGIPPGGIAQRGRKGPRPGWFYWVYDRESGALITHGNSKDCANALFMSQKSFYSAVWKANTNPAYRYRILKSDS